MRISNQNLHTEILANLQNHATRRARLQAEAASGKRIRVPADDPPGMGRALTIRDSLAANEQFLDNIAVAGDWLTASETSLDNLGDVLQRALNIARAAGSDTQGAAERAAFATQVTNLIEEALDSLNARHRDQYVFAGYKTSTQPFALVTGAPDSVTYGGDAGLRNVEIEPGRTLTMNVVGSAVSSVFADLIALRDNLSANNAAGIRSQVAALETSLQTTLNTIADIGARQQRLTRTRGRLESIQINLQAFLQETEDVDLAEAILLLQEEEIAYQATLRTAARLTQPNLFDFLR